MALVRTTAVLTVVSLLTAGCAVLGGAQTEPAVTYDLSAIRFEGRSQSSGGSGRSGRWQVVLQEPTALRALAGDKIVVKPNAAEINYFGDAIWNDRLPRLLQARMLETLQQSDVFAAVSDGRDRVDADLELSTHLSKFQVELTGAARKPADSASAGGEGGKTGRSGQAVVEMMVKVIDPAEGRVIARRQFDASVYVARDTPANGVAGLDAGLQDVLGALFAWLEDVAVARTVRVSERTITRPNRAAGRGGAGQTRSVLGEARVAQSQNRATRRTLLSGERSRGDD